MKYKEQFLKHFTPAQSSDNIFDQRSFPSNEQRNVYSQFIRQNSASQGRQLDKLYEMIYEKDIDPRQIIKKNKSEASISNSAYYLQKDQQNQQNYPCSMQKRISISHFKNLIKTQYHDQFQSTKKMDHLQQEFSTQKLLNKKISAENIALKKQMLKLRQKSEEDDKKIQDLQKKYKQVTRKYSNLSKQADSRQQRLKQQLKKIRAQKQSYEHLINALKQSIHILKGRQVSQLADIWKEWKQIFQVASLHKCRSSKKNLNKTRL